MCVVKFTLNRFDEVYKKVHKRPKKFGAEHKFKDYLEHKFKSLHPQPEWATKLAATGKVRTEDDDGEDLERVAGDVTTGQFRLDSSSLNYKTCGSIDRVESGKGSYRSIDFHPLDSYIILSKREYVTLYHLNERNSKRVKNIKFDDFMIEQATIRPGGQELWLSSSRKAGRLHYYDFLTDRLMKLPLRRSAELLHFRQFSFSPNDRYACGTGQHNLVHLLDTDSKEVLFDFKINSNSVATVFSPDSSKVFVHSAEGKVYVFDIRQNGRCLHRFVDEGCIQGTALAVSANRQYFACGSESGIVNLYDYDTVLQSREPTPIKRATHLLTAVNRIRFNHSTEIMTISSDQADNSIKCLHLPSFNVFADFPRLKTNYGKVTDVAFSPNSHYFAFANDAGKSYLNRLLSFDKY